MSHDPCRMPLPPPFPVGTRLRYIGERRVYAGLDDRRPLLAPGMEVEITRVRVGARGTGRQLIDYYGCPMTDDDGEPILDRTIDGVSIYEIEDATGRCRLRRIEARAAAEWETVFGPYKVGDFVQEGITFYGIVVGAGPKRFRVQWTNTTRNEYRQDYRGIRRAVWPDAETRVKVERMLRAEVRPWSER